MCNAFDTFDNFSFQQAKSKTRKTFSFDDLSEVLRSSLKEQPQEYQFFTSLELIFRNRRTKPMKQKYVQRTFELSQRNTQEFPEGKEVT